MPELPDWMWDHLRGERVVAHANGRTFTGELIEQRDGWLVLRRHGARDEPHITYVAAGDCAAIHLETQF